MRLSFNPIAFDILNIFLTLSVVRCIFKYPGILITRPADVFPCKKLNFLSSLLPCCISDISQCKTGKICRLQKLKRSHVINFNQSRESCFLLTSCQRYSFRHIRGTLQWHEEVSRFSEIAYPMASWEFSIKNWLTDLQANFRHVIAWRMLVSALCSGSNHVSYTWPVDCFTKTLGYCHRHNRQLHIATKLNEEYFVSLFIYL